MICRKLIRRDVSLSTIGRQIAVFGGWRAIGALARDVEVTRHREIKPGKPKASTRFAKITTKAASINEIKKSGSVLRN